MFPPTKLGLADLRADAPAADPRPCAHSILECDIYSAIAVCTRNLTSPAPFPLRPPSHISHGTSPPFFHKLRTQGLHKERDVFELFLFIKASIVDFERNLTTSIPLSMNSAMADCTGNLASPAGEECQPNFDETKVIVP